MPSKKLKVKNKKEVNWAFTLWISLFFGVFGVDRFLMGKIPTGILKLITLGGFGLWWLIDLISLLTMREFKDITWTNTEDRRIHIVLVGSILVIIIATYFIYFLKVYSLYIMDYI